MPFAKFKINQHISRMGGHLVDNAWKPEVLTTVEMNVVTGGSEENKKFFASTPTGSIIIGGLSSEITALFPLDKEVYVEFTVDE